jgi:hypothetical protein
MMSGKQRTPEYRYLYLLKYVRNTHCFFGIIVKQSVRLSTALTRKIRRPWVLIAGNHFKRRIGYALRTVGDNFLCVVPSGGRIYSSAALYAGYLVGKKNGCLGHVVRGALPGNPRSGRKGLHLSAVGGIMS